MPWNIYIRLIALRSLKSLTVVNFRRSDDATSASGSTTPGAAPAKANAEAEYICPCCRKTLSNNVASFGMAIRCRTTFIADLSQS